MKGEQLFTTIKDSLVKLNKVYVGEVAEQLVDPGCRLRSMIKFCDELDEAWSQTIKAKSTGAIGSIIIPGKVFSAHIKTFTKERVDLEQVRKLLGSDVPIKHGTETQLTYKPRF